MTNLPITANTSPPPGKSGNALQAGNGAESNIRRTAQRSFAEAISAHLLSATGLAAISDTRGEAPVSFSAVLNRHIGTAKTDSATDTAASLFAADSEDTPNNDLAAKPDASAKREPASASAATADASGIVSSMMHQVVTRQTDSAAADTRSNIPVEQGMTRKGHSARANIAATTISPHQPEMATRDSGPSKAMPLELADENAPHTDETTLKDMTKSAIAVTATKQSDTKLSHIGDPNNALEKTAKSFASEARMAPSSEKTSVQNAPQLATDKFAKAEPVPATVDSPASVSTTPNSVFSHLTARLGENGTRADSRDRRDILNVPKTINTPPANDLGAASSLKADHGRAPLAINVTSPVGSSDWPKEFSQKIVWMGDQKSQVAELHLNPPDLGPLDVVLKVSGNQATAQFTSTHSAVRDAIENAIPKLREMLAENGVTLGNTSVSDQAPQYRGADGSTNQGSSENSRHGLSNQGASNSDTTSTDTPVVHVRQHNGLVDTFA